MFRQMFEEKYMRFPEGREKALTFSYDDGVEADGRLIALFKKYGLKATFNLNSRLFGCKEWHNRMDEAQTCALFGGCGMEIALHGARHIHLTKVPLAEAVKEICDNRSYLEEKFGRIVDGMAYAYNSYNDEVIDMLRKLGVKYARTTESSHTFSLPADWLKLKPTCHHCDAEINSLADKFLNTSPSSQFKNREPYLFYIWGHSYEFDDDGNWDLIEGLCDKLSGRADIWYATNVEIYRYVQAYDRLEFSIDGERVYNPSAISVWIEVRGKTYEIRSGCTVGFDK